MKEKEVDLYLALASFCQLMLIGTSAAFFSEITNDFPKTETVFLSAFGSVSCVLAALILYAKAFEIIKNND